MLAGVLRGKIKKPRRVLLYGTHGIGKTTWAAGAPSPIFLATEEGGNDVDCVRTPLISDFGKLTGWISQLATEEHEFRTVVLDTADWAERLIHRATAEKAGKGNLEEIGYGKGYTLSLDLWDFLLRGLNFLRDSKGMGIIILAHATIANYQAPDADTYQRYVPDLHKSASPMLQEWADEVLFATYRISTIKRDERFNQERTRAVGTGERIVYTTEMPTHLAKRRVPLPDVLPLDFSAYAQHLNRQPESKDISGIVVNGSSKPQAAEAAAT